MKITRILTGETNILLKRPFTTALRTVSSANSLVIKIETDTEHSGYGEAPPVVLITGDSKASAKSAVLDFIAPAVIGEDIENIEGIIRKINRAMVHNTTAKAAVDMAVYDLYAKFYKAPLYKLLGGYRREVETDLTISINSIEEMVKDSIEAVNDGYRILKVKVGKDPKADVTRIAEIRRAVGEDVKIRVDANQGWLPKDSVRIIRQFEDKGLNIELVEQPVKASDIAGLKFVTDNVLTPILADEAVFSVENAIDIIKDRAADLINIKLMKTGGIYNALKICAVAETYGVECMIGCMLESKLAVSAAAHLACAKAAITITDLDGPGLCKDDPFKEGPDFNGRLIEMNDAHGIGFTDLSFIKWE